jgi:hypothetical protein
VQSLVPAGVSGESGRLIPQALRAKKIREVIPDDPSAPAWSQAPAFSAALTPLWWRDDRIESVQVQALHNGKELALLLVWSDATQDASIAKPQLFSDAVALQLSAQENPPFFGMGDAQHSVHLWTWKATWQQDRVGRSDIENAYPHAAVDWYPAQRTYEHGDRFEVSESKTTDQDPGLLSGWGAENPVSDPKRSSAAEEATAAGFGTLSTRPKDKQRLQASGSWQDGQWRVIFRRPLSAKTEDELPLAAGRTISVGIAIFDGNAKDRNGQKNVSVWNTLHLER